MHIREGEGEIISGATSYAFFPGLIIIVPPNESYKLRPSGKYSIISVEGEFARLDFLTEISFIRDNFYNEGKMLAEAIVRARHVNQDYMMALFDAYIRYVSKNITANESFSSIIHEITTKIESNYSDEDFDLAALLGSVGYTEDYVRAKFLQITGMTPVKYLTTVRMNNAKLMLKTFGNDVSIQEIAVKCGYFDAAYFSRCFKKIFKVSPKQYRDSLSVV